MADRKRKYKHRVVVEVTLDSPKPEVEAVRALDSYFHSCWRTALVDPHDQGIIKISRPKEFSRVFRSEYFKQIRQELGEAK